jgi:hypothetical protein
MVKKRKSSRKKKESGNSNIAVFMLFAAIAYFGYQKYSEKVKGSLKIEKDRKKIKEKVSKRKRNTRKKTEVTTVPKGEDTGEVSYQLSKENLVTIYKKLLVEKEKAQIIYNFQMWRNADFRLRKEIKLAKNSLGYNNFEIGFKKKQNLWQEHVTKRVSYAESIVAVCDELVPDLDIMRIEYKNTAEGEF